MHEQYPVYFQEELEILLRELSPASKLRQIVETPIRDDVSGGRAWPYIAMLACESVSGSPRPAAPAAVAISLLMKAADVFDDIEDEDSAESLSSRAGRAVAVNAASGMLILAEKALARLPLLGVSPTATVRILDIINGYYIDACIGQHRDIAGEGKTEAAYFEIAMSKSGSQVAAACHAGALAGGAGEDVAGRLGLFGSYIGTAAQLMNDIQGTTELKDILHRKVTLPVIFALEHAPEDAKSALLKAYHQKGDEQEAEYLRDLLFSSGAVYYARIKLTETLEKANRVLSSPELDTARTDGLREFINHMNSV